MSEATRKSEVFNPAARVERMLRSAGVNEDMINKLLADPSTVQGLIDDPSRIPLIAAANPSAQATAYEQARTGLGLGDPSVLTYQQYGGADALVAQELKEKGYVLNPSTGGFEIDGVVVDPSQGVDGVFLPTNAPGVAGSEAWLDKIQDQWSESRVEKWRKTLNKWGADISTTGGFDHEFLQALQMFHKYRYLNRGKVIPLGPAGGNEPVDVFGDSELRTMVRAQEERLYGDVPGIKMSDEEVDEWAGFIKNVARKMQTKKDMTPEQAATEASFHFQEKFAKDPVYRDLQRSREQEEENTELRDSLLSIADFVGNL